MHAVYPAYRDRRESCMLAFSFDALKHRIQERKIRHGYSQPGAERYKRANQCLPLKLTPSQLILKH